MIDDASNEAKRRDAVRNERLKLTATWLNNIGVGCVIAGFVNPMIAQGGGFALDRLLALGLLTGPWFVA